MFSHERGAGCSLVPAHIVSPTLAVSMQEVLVPHTFCIYKFTYSPKLIGIPRINTAEGQGSVKLESLDTSSQLQSGKVTDPPPSGRLSVDK